LLSWQVLFLAFNVF